MPPVSQDARPAGGTGAGRTTQRVPRRARVERPPGPRVRFPGVRLLVARRPPTDFFADVARAFPRLAHLRIGPEHLYVLSHPDLVREVMVTQGRHTVKGRGLDGTKVVLGNGLLTAEGEEHRRGRRLVQPAFHQARVASYAEAMATAAAELSARWRAGTVVDMAAEMSGLTFGIVGRALFGSDLSADADRIATALTQVLDRYTMGLLPGAELLLRLPLPGNAQVRRAVADIDDVVYRLIAERRAAGDGDDVVSMLLAARDAGVGMSERQLRDEVVTLVLAGHETTAVALTWTWMQLSRNPGAAAAMRAEVAAAVGDRPVSYADLGRLPLVHATVAESMRLYPPAWAIGRRLTADLWLDGYLVPAGSLAAASQWALHRDPRFWTRPLSFAPERWLTPDGRFDEAAPGQPRYAWFPFGAGSRVCIGADFAWVELVLVLATLVRDWAPELVPGQRVATRAAVTLRPAAGMRMVLRPAGGAPA